MPSKSKQLIGPATKSVQPVPNLFKAPAPEPAAIAAPQLNRATGNRTTLAGPSLRQMQRQYGNFYIQHVATQAPASGTPQPQSIVQPQLRPEPANDADEWEADRVAQRTADPIDAPGLAGQLIQPSTGDRKNKTGLPDRLKAGIETLSGLSMDDVRVRYNSPKPAQLHALAYAQGTEIHVGPGQERHLPHEAWHVVQQMQGRVKPTVQVNGLAVNDERGLEREANVMGTKALEIYRPIQAPSGPSNQVSTVEQQKEPTELFEDSSAAIGASREKVNLNFLSAPPIIQRNIVNDHLHEVQTFLNLQDSYQARVFDQIYHSYIGKTRHSPVAEQMASGLKVWAANYYNKSHAYLYEAKKADDFTRYPQYAILGVDTDKNPDLEVINLFFRYQQRYIGSSRSIEFKTTTSNHDVEKRDEEKGGKTVFDTRFDRHILTVDNSTAGENYYPFTDREISTRYGFLRNQDPKQFQWLYNQRLKKKISHYISRKTFSAPVEVRLEYRGKRYAYYSTDDR